MEVAATNYEFVVRDKTIFAEYSLGFSVNDLFVTSSVGIVTSRDSFVIDENKSTLGNRIKDFLTSESPREALEKFDLRETQKWTAAKALNHAFDENNIKPISYRPFDDRLVYYSDNFIERSRREVMQNFSLGNIGLVTGRTDKNPFYSSVFISKSITETKLGESSTQSYVFPLYVYEQDGAKFPNFNREIYNKIISGFETKVEPENILDYVYAVLYSPSYREKFQELLKIDFPRVPYPKDKKQFLALAKLGQELRELHLLESPKVSERITTYSIVGDDKIEKIEYKGDKVYINKTQYFGGVPKEAWQFYIGGYQPAQKWLKDRKGRALSAADISHYQKIIVALNETIRVMSEIDKAIPA